MVCLDAGGYFDDRPQSQRLPDDFGLLFPRLARQLRANERRSTEVADRLPGVELQRAEQ